MKRLVVLSFLLGVLVSFSSCKKKIYGCMDDTALNYSPVATEDGQDCVYAEEEEVLVSNTINNVTWSNQGTYWNVLLTWPSITTEVINNGAVSIFIGDGTEWTQLPYTIFWTGYQTNVWAYYYSGGAEVVWEDSDGTLPSYPALDDFKLVIYK